jgi:hypothetical protein
MLGMKGIMFSTAMAMAMAMPAGAQQAGDDQAAELAKKLANPIASLISLPLQYNYDTDYGVNDEGTKHYVNVQPVIPFSISENWNVISRTIVPLVWQSDIPSGNDASGVGDIVQSLFFSPKAPTASGWIWGVGPVLLIPASSDDALSGRKWGAGPTGVFLKQEGPWTVGLLANHIWSFAGEDDHADISSTFLQPFCSYLFKKTFTTVGLNTETTYNWEAEESSEAWSVPVNLMVNQLLKIGGKPVQFSVGARYWAASPERGPEGFGARAAVTFLFPKH